MNVNQINLKPLIEAIDKFLAEQGVLQNNFNGSITGVIGSNNLKWSSYNADYSLTVMDKREIASAFDKELVKIKNELMPEEFKVEIVFEPDRDGMGGGVHYLIVTPKRRKEYIRRNQIPVDPYKGKAK